MSSNEDPDIDAPSDDDDYSPSEPMDMRVPSWWPDPTRSHILKAPEGWTSPYPPPPPHVNPYADDKRSWDSPEAESRRAWVAERERERELDVQARIAYLEANPPPPSGPLPPSRPITEIQVREPFISFSLKGSLDWFSRSERPDWPGMWPVHHFVFHRHKDTELEHDLVALGFRVVFCAESNKKLIAHEQRIRDHAPWLSVQRYISKAQHLHERLLEIGIDFQCSYYESASPYAPGALDKRTTLQNLKSALVAAGLQGSDAESIFEQEFEEYKMPPMNGLQTDVLLYTNSKFLSGLSAKRRAWWSLMGYTVRKIPGQNFKGEDILRPVGHGKIAVIFDEPPLREFDQSRPVKNEHITELQASGNHKLIELELELQSLGNHKLIEPERRWHELRPLDMEFGTGVQRGYGTRSDAPKIIVSTSNPVIAAEAFTCIRRRINVERITERREIDWTALAVFGDVEGRVKPQF